MGQIKVIVLYSLAYSGTTWLTLVLGSGKDIFCLGAGDRVFEQGPNNPHAMCLVHPENCEVWPTFFEGYNKNKNFFVQLASHTGIKNFVINNPSIALFNREFTDPALDVRVIQQVRDGRAALASAMRHHPERVDNVYQSALAWLYRGTLNNRRRVENTGKPSMLLRYEDAVADPSHMLATVAEHTGYPYTSQSLRYWEFEHHVTGANLGALDILIRMQGGAGIDHKRKAYYDDLLSYLRKTNGVPKLDQSWRELYDDVDLAAYDFVAGQLYAEYGYERPLLTQAAQDLFQQRFNPPSDPADAIAAIAPWKRPTPADPPGRADIITRAVRKLSRLSPWRFPA